MATASLRGSVRVQARLTTLGIGCNTPPSDFRQYQMEKPSSINQLNQDLVSSRVDSSSIQASICSLSTQILPVLQQKRFAVVPNSSVFLVHIFGPASSLQHTNLYHNVSLQALAVVVVQRLWQALHGQSSLNPSTSCSSD